MGRKLLLVIGAITVATFVAPFASADSFTFNEDFCSNPCLGGVAASNDGGTVTVTQSATNIVDVKVALASGLLFHNNALESFAFDILLGGVSNTTLTDITSGSLAAGDIELVSAGTTGSWTFQQGSAVGNTNPAGGNFEYGFQCSAGPGACSPATSTLEFQVDLTGLTPSNFETLTGVGGSNKVDFTANVANGTCTGMIGAGNGSAQSTPSTGTGGTACGLSEGPPPPSVPEPSSVLLLGTAGLGIVMVMKRRFGSQKQS